MRVSPHQFDSFPPSSPGSMAEEPDERYGTAGALPLAAGRALTATPASPVPADQLGTMEGPQVLAANDIHTLQAPPRPPVAEAPGPGPGPAAAGSNWLVIGVGAIAIIALVLAISLVIGATSANRSAPSTQSVLPSISTHAPSALPTATTVAADPTTSWAATPPPLLTGPDASRRRCDTGITHPNHTRPGSRAGRGSTATSCLFAYNVLTEYWRMGPPNKYLRTVNAYGAVPCNPTKVQCLGKQFVMDCQDLGQGWITCTGGVDARVYIY